jgi:hypothetical protein
MLSEDMAQVNIAIPEQRIRGFQATIKKLEERG